VKGAFGVASHDGSDTLVRLAAEGIDVSFNPKIGMILDVVVDWRGRRVAPFARAPWRDLAPGSERFPGDMPPHLAQLSADFFCAPFCADDVEGAPPHGKTANSPWRLVDKARVAPYSRATFELSASVAGASITKTLLLIDGHPFLYQQHVLTGASLEIPVSHHAMVDASGGLDLSLSPVAFAETPARPPESDPAMGRSLFAYPARSVDPAAFPMADGTTASLLTYPVAARHEDVVMLVDQERAANALGWAIARRRGHGDSVMLAKPSGLLPQTMLWFSNGGRYYPPWLGEHTDVLGIEMGCSYSSYGWAASVAPNPLSEAGIPTAVTVPESGRTLISFAMGAVPGEVCFEDDRFLLRATPGVDVPFARDLVIGDRLLEQLA
jgi:hypothetical protein